MSQPTTVLLVKFKSALGMQEIRDVINSRIDEFRALPGLMQKFYLQETATGEISGLYLWDSAESLSEFAKSELRATIANAYQVIGEPRIEAFDIIEVLRET